ncbi:SDR family oxidoreductase [Veronia pacifica]|uniref:Short chain dehydrogenase n=1 Tax=Veronia pacifica TaxID=1080227 RepID=A0A1C3EIE1_9GAMM|nr:SDR family oxidoreductase [Veronia pacifica]ODA33016.1 Short chain dehydrogenase [Veronia pacifica]
METVLITGASRGIGLELTRQFLRLDYRVISTYRGQPSEQLNSLLSHDALTLYELEVTDDSSINELVARLGSSKIDILINNAGVLGSTEQALNTVEVNDWLNTFATNTIAPLMVSRALVASMARSENPRIITISSQMGSLEDDGPAMYAYRSSKTAVNKVMQLLSLEQEHTALTVCSVHPGWVKTDMGGEDADITAEQSASGIADVIKNLTKEQNGTFLSWQGKEIPW